MSKYILGIWLLFICIIALVYEAKMTDVLLTSRHLDLSGLSNIEQCQEQNACCYSVGIIEKLLVEADRRYEGKLRQVVGSEKFLWDEVISGRCKAGLSSSMRVSMALRHNGMLCGEIETVPATAGLLANFMAVPFSDAFAVRKDASTAQSTLDIVNAGLGKTYSYAETNEQQSGFGIYKAHFAKSDDCIVREDFLKSSVSDHPLPVQAFIIPMAWVTFLVTVVFCCTVFRCMPKGLPGSRLSDSDDAEMAIEGEDIEEAVDEFSEAGGEIEEAGGPRDALLSRRDAAVVDTR